MDTAPKVEDLDDPALVNEHIRALDVAVKHAVAMEVPERETRRRTDRYAIPDVSAALGVSQRNIIIMTNVPLSYL